MVTIYGVDDFNPYLWLRYYTVPRYFLVGLWTTVKGRSLPSHQTGVILSHSVK